MPRPNPDAVIPWHCHTCFHGMPTEQLAGAVAVVIDVIRASTTITTALAHGSCGVFPVESVAAARSLLASLPPGTLAGGERKSVRIEGFDLGNSPREYTRERVAGRQIVFTTTNGTAALASCHAAARVMIGSLVNRTAVAAAAQAAARELATSVHLVCAGIDREVADEDLLGAGAILDAAAAFAPSAHLDAMATDALTRYRTAIEAAGSTRAALLEAALAETHGGLRMRSLGMEADIPVVAALDTFNLVPILDPARGLLDAHRDKP